MQKMIEIRIYKDSIKGFNVEGICNNKSHSAFLIFFSKGKSVDKEKRWKDIYKRGRKWLVMGFRWGRTIISKYVSNRRQ